MGDDPVERILLTASRALKARRQLKSRDPRRTSVAWLRPSWPDAFVVQMHRRRLIENLANDQQLRHEVRVLLPLMSEAESQDSPLPADLEDSPAESQVRDLVADAIMNAPDPRVALEAVALHADPLIATAASPYLRGDIALPKAADRPAATVEQATTRAPDPDLRRLNREARHELRATRQALEAEQHEVGRLRQELEDARSRIAVAASSLEAVRAQLPSRRQLKALAAASEHASALRDLRRKLDAERRLRHEEAAELRALAVAAEEALAKTQTQLDAETRGRRRLEGELGDATERARRLEPLVKRQADELQQKAAGMRNGPEKTHSLKRVEKLRGLADSLRDLYALNVPPDEQTESAKPSSGLTATARTRSRGLRAVALGGANHIGGSALLIEAGDTRLLVDAGLKPQTHSSNPGPDRINEAIQKRVDAIVVTHAHADHAGFVPWVVEKQRGAKVLCSPQTKALLPTVWADSARVMRAEADAMSAWSGRREPPYGDGEVAQAEDALQEVRFGQTVTVADLDLTLFPAGHILGAAGVVIQADDRRIVITGDIDDRGQASVGPAKIPSRLTAGADLMIVETTYCDSLHRDRGHEGNGLIHRTEEVLAGGGRVLIPAFGLGRAQEIALLLGDQLPEVDVLVDGLARDISELYTLNGAPEILRGRVRKVRDRHREILGFHGGVVITTSGMLTGGAAIPWAEAVLREPESALFLCGHQDEEAPGRELERLANAAPDEPRQVHLRDDQGRSIDIDVAATVHRYNLSAHADRAGLTRIIDEVGPEAIMLVHGEPGPQAIFRHRLEAVGYTVVNNREVWDADAPVRNMRVARRRHGSSHSGSRRVRG